LESLQTICQFHEGDAGGSNGETVSIEILDKAFKNIELTA